MNRSYAQNVRAAFAALLLRCLLCVLLCTVLAGPSYATTCFSPGLFEQLEEAEIVVHGEVTGVEDTAMPVMMDSGRVFQETKLVTFRTLKIFKGLDDTTQSFTAVAWDRDNLDFEIGETGLVVGKYVERFGHYIFRNTEKEGSTCVVPMYSASGALRMAHWLFWRPVLLGMLPLLAMAALGGMAYWYRSRGDPGLLQARLRKSLRCIAVFAVFLALGFVGHHLYGRMVAATDLHYITKPWKLDGLGRALSSALRLFYPLVRREDLMAVANAFPRDAGYYPLFWASWGVLYASLLFPVLRYAETKEWRIGRRELYGVLCAAAIFIVPVAIAGIF